MLANCSSVINVLVQNGIGKRLPVRHRLASDLAGRIHSILSTNCLFDFQSRDVERSQLVGIYPDPERIFARPEDGYARDARHPENRVLQINICRNSPGTSNRTGPWANIRK